MSRPKKQSFSLEEFREFNNYVPQVPPESINFLGRKDELKVIEDFLKSTKRILEIVGVPMIGKTALTQEFCKKNKIKYVRIPFREKPYKPFQDLEKKLFGKGNFNDFSNVEKGTLLIIENFEQALHWVAEDSNLHKISARGITKFLNKLVENECKLLIETRFKIRFTRDLKTYFVQTLQIEGIDTNLFWEYYESKNFTTEQFDNLCQKFDKHTGLLALAYNDAEWLYENELLKAVYEPKATSRSLWKLLEMIIKKLDRSERQILAALTLWQEAISKKEIQIVLQDYFTANLDNTLKSLKKKLLIFSDIKDQHLDYALNPYLAEVFFAFMEKSTEITEIKNLPAFQQRQIPRYDKIKQAHTKGDYRTFFALIKEKRKARKYDEVIDVLRSVYWEDPKPEVILNEIGVTYKWQKKYKEAKEVLKQAIDLNHVPAMNELAMIYKGEKNLKEAKKLLQQALTINDKDVKTLNELAIVYKQERNFEEAKKTLQKALTINNKDVKTLNQLAKVYKQENNIDEAKKVLLQASDIDPNNVIILNELAKIYNEERDFEKALKIVETGLKIDKYDHNLLNIKENILQVQKEYDINKEYNNVQSNIQKALEAIQNAKYPDYFEEMDDIIPINMQTQYAELKKEFISGNYPNNFHEQLRVFTNEVKRVLND